MSLDDFYTDEPIDYGQSDSSGDTDFQTDASEDMSYIDSVHNWDYFEPEEDDDELLPWESSDIAASADMGGQPKKIVELLEMIRRQPWQITREKNFYEQALFMANYTDSADIVPFQCYFPVYNDMSVAQLRSYFTIRKMWRQGKFPDVPLSYLFVYVYETLMQIGIHQPEEGYEILQEMLAAYRTTYANLQRYLGPWLRDYVVYYNLSPRFQETFADEWHNDALAATLSDYKDAKDSMLLDALIQLSGYDPTAKVLFKKVPEKATACMTAVLRAIIPVIEHSCHHRIETFCLGSRTRRQVRMFANAVFYNPRPVRTAEIRVSPRTRYFCQGGLWAKDVFICNQPLIRRTFTAIFHEADRQMRIDLGIKPMLKPGIGAAPYAAVIKDAVSQWMEHERAEEARKEAERRRVSIDFSKLKKIRSDAEVVMEKLASDESEPLTPINTMETIAPAEPVAPVESTATTEAAEPEKTPEPLKPTAPLKDIDSMTPTTPAVSQAASPGLAFLRHFLSGGDWRSFLRDHHIPEGVMVEQINDKAMDSIGDIVLEDDGNGLKLIEDYREDVEQWLKEDS